MNRLIPQWRQTRQVNWQLNGSRTMLAARCLILLHAVSCLSSFCKQTFSHVNFHKNQVTVAKTRIFWKWKATYVCRLLNCEVETFSFNLSYRTSLLVELLLNKSSSRKGYWILIRINMEKFTKWTKINFQHVACAMNEIIDVRSRIWCHRESVYWICVVID